MSKNNSDYKKSFLQANPKGTNTVLKDLSQPLADAQKATSKKESSPKKHK